MRFVLLPGMDGTGQLFSALTEIWAEDSPPLIVSYPPDQLLDYPALQSYALRSISSGEPYVLVAESFSGPIAIGIGATRPPSLKGIVLCSTFVRRPFGRIGAWLSYFVSHFLFRLGKLSDVATRFLLRREGLASQQVDAFQKAIREVLPEVLSHRIKQVLKIDVSEALRCCDVPILYVHSIRDGLLPRHRDFLINKGSNIQTINIDSGHFVLQTRPHEALRAIRDFSAAL